MSARTGRFGVFGPGSTKSKAAGAVIACAVMLLAGCGGSGGSAADAGAPVIRGDAPEAGDSGSTVTVPGVPQTPTVVVGDGKVTVTVAAGATGGTPTSYNVSVWNEVLGNWKKTGGSCTVTGASGSCDVTGLPSAFTKVQVLAINTAGYSSNVGETAKFKVVEAGGEMWYLASFVTGFGSNTSMPPQQASTPTPLRANGFNPSGKDFIGWSIYNLATHSSNSEVVYADKAIYSAL